MLHRARTSPLVSTQSEATSDAHDGSITSTISVKSARSFKRNNKQDGKMGKRVHFSLCSNKMHPSQFIPEEDFEAIWYSNDDYSEFREQLVAGIKEAAQHTLKSDGSAPYSRAVLDLYERCCTVRSPAEAVQLTKSERTLLQKCFVENDCHGLERYCIKKIRNDKAARKDAQIEAVLAVQQRRLRKKLRSFDQHKVMCENSERQTLAGAQFARIMADVQASSVRD